MTQIQNLIGTEICGTRISKHELKKYLALKKKNRLQQILLINAHSTPEYTTGQNTRVAIINSGCCTDHPELQACLEKDKHRQGRNLLACKSIYPDNPADSHKKYLLNDYASHGTAVAGIISSIAPEAKQYIFKVVETSKPDSLEIRPVIRALKFTIHNTFDCDVINLSLVIDENPELKSICDELTYKEGKLLVAAAGNTRIGPVFPAAWASVISVGSVDMQKAHSIFSNIDQTVDICAPGEDVFSLDAPQMLEKIIGALTFQKIYKYQNAYSLNSGTSFAVPHVAGVLALGVSILKKRGYKIGKDIPAAQIKELLCSTAYRPNIDIEKTRRGLSEEIKQEIQKRSCGEETEKFEKSLTPADLQQELSMIENMPAEELYRQAFGAGIVEANEFLKAVFKL